MKIAQSTTTAGKHIDRSLVIFSFARQVVFQWGGVSCDVKRNEPPDWVEIYRKLWEDRFKAIDRLLEELLKKKNPGYNK